jgi:hypothetical protein
LFVCIKGNDREGCGLLFSGLVVLIAPGSR